jgi:hypothetical protein
MKNFIFLFFFITLISCNLEETTMDKSVNQEAPRIERHAYHHSLLISVKGETEKKVLELYSAGQIAEIYDNLDINHHIWEIQELNSKEGETFIHFDMRESSPEIISIVSYIEEMPAYDNGLDRETWEKILTEIIGLSQTNFWLEDYDPLTWEEAVSIDTSQMGW